MRRPLIDINVLLDVLGEREPFGVSASRVWTAAETGRARGLVSADSFSTLYYLLRQASDSRAAHRGVSLVLSVFEVVELDEQILRQAADSPLRDFEDAIQYHSAIRGKADCIVTRDLAHYRNSEMPVLSPDEFLATLDAE